MIRQSFSKYGVEQSERGKEERTYRGRVYHSKREAEYAAVLDVRKRLGEIAYWTPQVPIPVMVNGVKVCVYVADFAVTLADGRCQLHEVKGMETPVWKLKRRLLEATWLKEHPEVELIVR